MFLKSVHKYSMLWIYHTFRHHLPVEGYLGCLQFLSIMNKGAKTFTYGFLFLVFKYVDIRLFHIALYIKSFYILLKMVSLIYTENFWSAWRLSQEFKNQTKLKKNACTNPGDSEKRHAKRKSQSYSSYRVCFHLCNFFCLFSCLFSEIASLQEA